MRVLAAGLLAHLVLLLGPVLVVEGQLPTDSAAWVFLALATVFCAVEASATRPTRGSGPAEAGAWLPSLTGGVLLAVFLAALLGRGRGSLAGALLMAGGVALRWAAMRGLGRWFVSEVRLLPGHELVTDGLYGWVRHPSELGLLAIALGAAVLLGSPVAAVGTAGLGMLVLWRVRLEDRMLAHHFPEAFAHWADSVPALLPWPGRRPEARKGPGAQSMLSKAVGNRAGRRSCARNEASLDPPGSPPADGPEVSLHGVGLHEVPSKLSE